MTVIEARTTDQVLSAVILPKIAPNNVNSVKLSVDFDNRWDDYGKSAIFFTEDNPTPWEKVLDADDTCKVPSEVLVKEGHLFIALRGVKVNGETKTSTLLRVKISKGTPLVITSDPTEDVYSQLLRAYGKVKQEIATERARIDQFTTLGEGSTTGDAELEDIRIGANGETYKNAGTAVRKQVAELHGVLNGEGITLLPEDFKQGSWKVDEGGYYDTNLRLIYSLPISKGDVITVNPNGLYVSILVTQSKDSLNLMDSKGYTQESFEFGCSYDGYAIILICKHHTEQIKIIPEELTSKITVYRSLTSVVGRGKTIYPVQYEMGNISISDSEIVYNGATTRVRTPEGYSVPLARGDIIRLTNYDDTRFFVGWTLADGTIGRKGWLTHDFVCPINAEYVILVCNTTDTQLPNAETLGDLIEVQTSISNEFLEKSFAEAQNQRKEIRKIIKANHNIRSINHRGYNTLAPENTLSAYKISKRMGFDYVECDVMFTSDGVAVILHDGTIDRTSNGTGKISEMTFNEVRALDFGSWFSDTFIGEKIPSFEEFIELCKHINLHPYIELKVGTEEQIAGLVKTVKMYGMQDNVTWISFSDSILRYVKEAYNKARLGYLANTLDEAAIVEAQGLKTESNEVFINSAYSSVTEATAELCANANIPLEVWTINDKNALIALPSYVSGFSSDKLIANEVFYDNSGINDKVVAYQGGDFIVYPVGLKGEKGDMPKFSASDKDKFVTVGSDGSLVATDITVGGAY